MPFIPQIKIFNPTLNTRVTLEMKDFVKYLGIMIDSELSWKHHVDFICHKMFMYKKRNIVTVHICVMNEANNYLDLFISLAEPLGDLRSNTLCSDQLPSQASKMGPTCQLGIMLA